MTQSERFNSDDWYVQAREAITKKTCPQCYSVGTLSLSRTLTAKPIGSFSLAGNQMKVSALQETFINCSACDMTARINPQ